uniref:Secreted protein n=1 Tax=Anas zonorhyncha TaxID=75864 RepID=A0A8B9UYD2_9AVES
MWVVPSLLLLQSRICLQQQKSHHRPNCAASGCIGRAVRCPCCFPSRVRPAPFCSFPLPSSEPAEEACPWAV